MFTLLSKTIYMSSTNERTFFLKEFVIGLIALLCIDFIFMNVPGVFKGESIIYVFGWKKMLYWFIISLFLAYLNIRKRRKKSLEV